LDQPFDRFVDTLGPQARDTAIDPDVRAAATTLCRTWGDDPLPDRLGEVRTVARIIEAGPGAHSEVTSCGEVLIVWRR
jgi:hypothetical protein